MHNRKWAVLGLIATLSAIFAVFTGPRGGVDAQTSTVNIVIHKVCRPANDPGQFAFLVNTAVIGTGGCGPHFSTVASPSSDISEQGADGTNLADYTSDLSCALVAGVESCTFTNTRITPPGGVRAGTECNRTVTSPVSGGLVVHLGDECVVQSTSVSGGIRVDGGVLFVCGGSTVTGGIHVAVPGSSNKSSAVFLGDGAGCPGNNTINGGVSISGVSAVIVRDNQIRGGVRLTSNGIVILENNQIGGGCSQSGNSAITDNGQPNTYRSGGHATCP